MLPMPGCRAQTRSVYAPRETLEVDMTSQVLSANPLFIATVTERARIGQRQQRRVVLAHFVEDDAAQVARHRRERAFPCARCSIRSLRIERQRLAVVTQLAHDRRQLRGRERALFEFPAASLAR
jgi:hypothetical protein